MYYDDNCHLKIDIENATDLYENEETMCYSIKLH